MKKLFALLLLTISTVTYAQHPCAEAKIKHQNQSGKTTANTLRAARLMSKYDIHHYDIHIEALTQNAGFTGDAGFSAEVVAPIDTFCFQLSVGVILDSVWLDGVWKSVIRSGDDVLVPLTSTINIGQDVTLRVKYLGNYSSTGWFSQGFNKQTYYTTADTTIFTMSAIYSMKMWLPAKEMIYDKIDSVDMWITTELKNTGGSNGLLQSIDTVGSLRTFHWKTKYPIDYYLISVAVSTYQLRETYVKPANYNGDSILVQNFIFSDPGLQATLIPNLDQNDEMLKYYSETFGLYPFAEEKYGNCLARLGGGMEHQTMTTLGITELFILSHELFHQWFGDYVTCKTWHDISINEGFASYGEVLTEEHLFGKNAAINYMSAVHYNVMTKAGGSVYCPDTLDETRVFSSRLTYDKGSAVIGTLRYILGDSLFFGGIRDFLQKHAYSTASWADLKDDLEAYTGVTLDDYFTQWIYGEGFPTIKTKWRDMGSYKYVQLSQTTSVPSSVSFFKGPIDVHMANSNGDTIISHLDWQYQDQLFSIPLSGDIKMFKLDPEFHILHKLTTFQEDLTLGISEVSTSELKVYPNPVRDLLYLDAEQPISSYEVHNLLGQLMSSASVQSGGKIEIPTSNWSDGVYLIRVRLQDGRETVRQITKNH